MLLPDSFIFLLSDQISRMLAAKTALAVRYDALGEEVNTEMGVENRARLEIRIRNIEEGKVSTKAVISYHFVG